MMEGVCVRRDRFPPVKILINKFVVYTNCLLGSWLAEISFGVR